MNLPDIKKVPRWTWYTAGGLALGYGAIRLWKNRTTAADTGTTTDTPGGYVPQGVAGTAASPAGVIVPPVIVSGADGGDQAGTGLGDLQALYIGGTQTLIDSFQSVYGQVFGPIAAQNAGITDSLLAGNQATIGGLFDLLANAGPAPASVASPPQVAAPVTVAPAVAQSAPASAPKPCPPEYPFRSDRGCYKVACASGQGTRAKGRWHLYSNGTEVHVSSTC